MRLLLKVEEQHFGRGLQQSLVEAGIEGAPEAEVERKLACLWDVVVHLNHGDCEVAALLEQFLDQTQSLVLCRLDLCLVVDVVQDL